MYVAFVEELGADRQAASWPHFIMSAVAGVVGGYSIIFLSVAYQKALNILETYLAGCNMAEALAGHFWTIVFVQYIWSMFSQLYAVYRTRAFSNNE